MKIVQNIILSLFLLGSALLFAQPAGDWKKMSIQEKSTVIKKMSPNQKMSLLQNFKQDLMVEDLNIPENKREEFSALYEEYQKSQKDIKSTFQRKENFETLNDEDAQKELDASFEVGQKLLDNRKDFSRKVQRVLKPQQVLQLFENEGRMRSKVRDRSRELQNSNTSPGFRVNAPNSVERSSPNTRQRPPSGRR